MTIDTLLGRCREVYFFARLPATSFPSIPTYEAVSYTHLDVYKRQVVAEALIKLSQSLSPLITVMRDYI